MNRSSALHVPVTLLVPPEKELGYPLDRRMDISHHRARLDNLEKIKNICPADSRTPISVAS